MHYDGTVRGTVSLKKICPSPNPGTCERDLIWKQAVCRENQAEALEMKSSRSQAGP